MISQILEEIDKLAKLWSSVPSDFSRLPSLLYFTPDHQVAEHYAAYAKRRANFESVVMVFLTIPRRVIDSLEEPAIERLYWSAPEWKQLVWFSKTMRPLPKSLRKYRDTLLIIGNISKGAERKFQQMETWEDMTSECFFRCEPGNNLAVQYAFSGKEEGQESLTEHGNFEVFGFSVGELHRLLATYR
ncbi:hypothetical protein BX600DRAFT_502207 [Xylariales sp. PMI_506]|nr:hypothetical protein BX600DRAFT_502207 [Xylariales sp. PMI_506]